MVHRLSLIKGHRLNDTYVDDIISGDYNPEGATTLATQLTQFLVTAVRGVRKLTSNDPYIFSHIPCKKYPHSFLDHAPSADSIRLLRLAIFAQIARIFDALGWLTPITV